MSSLKTLYLIRHAESYENKLIHSFKTLVGALPSEPGAARPPIMPLFGLLNIPYLVDCPLSEDGVRQCERLNKWTASYETGKDGSIKALVDSLDPCLVVHSPLQRARQTCHAATGLLKPSTRPNTFMPEGVAPSSPGVRVEESPLMIEKTPTEWVPGFGGGLDSRIESFRTWVEEQPEERVVVVGHSQWFKRCLGMTFKFDNCDVWKVEINEGVWGQATRLYQGNVEDE